MGSDWVSSSYSGLLLVKKRETFRQLGFLLPLSVAILSMALRTYVRPVATLAVLAIAYLHWRYDLSELDFRSPGWRGDMIAILLMGLLSVTQLFFSPGSLKFAQGVAFLGMLDRLFANPASTTKNLFYFGFLTDCLSSKFSKWWMPVMNGLMYGLHEMTNPEYWYERIFFPPIS